MNDGLYDSMKLQFKFNIEYNYIENQLNIEVIGLKPIAEQYGSIADVKIFSDEDLLTDEWGGTTLNKEETNSMNQIIRLTKTTLTNNTPLGENIYYTNIDLHTTMKLYLNSSVLASYDTLSNFNMDTIIKP
jgi:hypothetical protein